MIHRGWAATVVAAATAGVGASVLVSGVGAQTPAGCVTQPATSGRVVVTCSGIGGEATLPGGREITVDLAGGSGGGVGDLPGGRGALLHATWTPEADTVVWAALGPAGVNGSSTGPLGGFGGLGGAASIILPRPFLDQQSTPGPWWWFVAAGGGGRGTSAEVGAGGDGGADQATGAGGNGGGGATGGTVAAAGRGTNGGLPALGPIGGLGVLGGGSGGSGFNGGGGGGTDGGGGGAGASRAVLGTATFAPAPSPGNGWARFSWTVAVPPEITSGAGATFVAGQPDSFTVSATGDPPPALSVEGLPPGLTFTDDGDGTGVISGVPLPGYSGDFDVTIRASNGSGPDAVQRLTLRVLGPAPGTSRAPSTPVTGSDMAPPVQGSDPQQDPVLAPVPAKTVVAVPVSGTVTIRRPDGTVAELKAGDEIPVGSIVDARNGVVRLTAARDTTGVTQTALFWNAVFRITQRTDVAAGGGRTAATARQLLTALTLRQRPAGCATTGSKRARAAAARGKPGKGGKRGKRGTRGKRAAEGLWGDGKGRFSVRGNSSSATVRGTKWYVENRCAGTYTRVVRGVVSVRDFVRKKTIVLRAGGTYTARKRGS